MKHYEKVEDFLLHNKEINELLILVRGMKEMYEKMWEENLFKLNLLMERMDQLDAQNQENLKAIKTASETISAIKDIQSSSKESTMALMPFVDAIRGMDLQNTSKVFHIGIQERDLLRARDALR